VRLPPLTAEAVLWLAGPVALSLVTLVVGLALFRRRHRLTGSTLVIVSIAGLLLSAGWIALAMRIEAVEHNSLARPYYEAHRASAGGVAA
jgi:hypothetical protein